MRRIAKSAFMLAIVLTAPPSAAFAQMGGAYGQQSTSPSLQGGSGSRPHSDKVKSELKALREEGLKLKEADGGTLSPEHQSYLQDKLNAIMAETKTPQ